MFIRCPIRSAHRGGTMSVPAVLRNQGGWDFFQILLIVALIAFFAATGYGIYNGLKSDSVVDRGQRELTALSQHINQRFSGGPLDFTGISNQFIIDNGLMPDTMKVGNNLQNAWGGPVTVDAGDTCGGDQTNYCITFEKVKKEACSAMAMTGTAGYKAVIIGGAELPAPLTALEASNLCAGQDQQTLIWRF